MKKKALSIVLVVAMIATMMPMIASADEEDPYDYIPADGIATTDLRTEGGDKQNNYHDEDVIVEYAEGGSQNIADKTYLVKLSYSFPPSVTHSSDARYEWDAVNKKYVKNTHASVETYSLGKGEFDVYITNMSNVPISFDVSYTPAEDGIFENTAEFTQNQTGHIDTIASSDYQTIGETNIQITDDVAATAGTDELFPEATCTGKLSVSGLKESQTAVSGGKYKLGTFRVLINEYKGEDDGFTIASLIGHSVPTVKDVTEEGLKGNEQGLNYLCAIIDGKLVIYTLAGGQIDMVPLTSKVEVNSNKIDEKDCDYVYTVSKEVHYEFYVTDGKLTQFRYIGVGVKDTFDISAEAPKS